jgi:hypothetical protein
MQIIDYQLDYVQEILELAREAGVTDGDFETLGVRDHQAYIDELIRREVPVSIETVENGQQYFLV